MQSPKPEVSVRLRFRSVGRAGFDASAYFLNARARFGGIGVPFSPTSVHFAPISLHVAPADPCFGPASSRLERVSRGLAANTVHRGDIGAGSARVNRAAHAR